MRPLFFLLCCAFASSASAQIMGMEIAWDNHFDQWKIFVGETEEGDLRKVWPHKASEWNYSLPADRSGSIRLKWAEDPSLWELRANGGLLLTARKWPGDYTTWRIIGAEETLTFACLDGNPNTWELRNTQGQNLRFQTIWEDNFSAWEVLGEELLLSEEIELFALHLAMIQTVF